MDLAENENYHLEAGILWRQIGGSRWQLLFQRKKIVKTATHLLNQL